MLLFLFCCWVFLEGLEGKTILFLGLLGRKVGYKNIQLGFMKSSDQRPTYM